MFKPLIAATILAKTIDEALRLGRDAVAQGADFPEFRLDFLNPDEVLYQGRPYVKNLNRLVKEFRNGIYTNRHVREAPPGSNQGFRSTGKSEEEEEVERQRISVLQTVADLEPEHIDVEYRFSRDNESPLNVNRKKTKLIISYHDFEKTPGREELRDIYNEMRKRRWANIIKIATMANRGLDVVRMEMLIDEFAPQGDLIAISMGQLGQEVRFEGPLNGTYLTYGALEGMSAAPGMPTIRELRKYYRDRQVS